MHDSYKIDLSNTQGPTSGIHNGDVIGSQTICQYHPEPRDSARLISSVAGESFKSDRHKCHQLMKWISPQDFSRAHDDFRSKAVKGTGQWFLDSNEFTSWKDGKSRHLWISGKAGAGKSFLSSTAINEMKNKSGCQVAYLYLKYDQPASVQDLLGNLASQLVGYASDSPPPGVISAWNDEKNKVNPFEKTPARSVIEELLSVLVTDQTLVIVDALDEFDHRLQRSLLKALMDLENARVMITSRFKATNERFEVVDIAAHHEDLHTYIDEKIRASDLNELVSQEKDLENEMMCEVTKRADGIFLMARLHVNALAACLTPGEIRDKLRSLPSDQDSMYESTLSRIKSQSQDRQQWAMTALGWILHSDATRPLEVDEFRHALQIGGKLDNKGLEAGDALFDHSRVLSEGVILAICCGLVEVQGRAFRLIHYSTQEYFWAKREALFPDFHSRIALACAKYLCLPQLAWAADTEATNVSRRKCGCRTENHRLSSWRPKDFTFSNYAGQHLKRYFQTILGEENRRVVEDQIYSLAQNMSSRLYYCYLLEHLDNLHISTTSIGTVAFIGSANLVKLYLRSSDKESLRLQVQAARESALGDTGPLVLKTVFSFKDVFDLTTAYGHSAFVDAVREGFREVANEVIADITENLDRQSTKSRSSPSMNPYFGTLNLNKMRDQIRLFCSSARGDTAAMTHLLRKCGRILPADDSTVLLRTKSYLVESSLFLCIEHGNIEGLQMLLDCQVDVNTQNNCSQTPLHRAVGRQDRSMVEALLGRNARLDLENCEGMTVLDTASRTRGVALQVFVDSIANSPSTRLSASRALIAAVQGSNLDRVQAIMKMGLNPSIQDPDGKVPLQVAVEHSQFDTIRCLVEHGADLKDHGPRALTIAIQNKHERLVESLMEAGLHPSIPDADGKLPAELALEHRDFDSLHILARHGAKLNHQASRVLTATIRKGFRYHVDVLIEAGVNPSLRDPDGKLPLQVAVQTGCHIKIEELLEHGADPNTFIDVEKTLIDDLDQCILDIRDRMETKRRKDVAKMPFGFLAMSGVAPGYDLGSEMRIMDLRKIQTLLEKHGGKRAKELLEVQGEAPDSAEANSSLSQTVCEA